MNFQRDVLNSGMINGAATVPNFILTQAMALTQYSRAAFISSPTGSGLTGIIVPYENRGVRPGYENRTIRIPRGL